MTAVVLESEPLRAWLAALPADDQAATRARPHPWIGRRRMVYLAGPDRVVTEACELFGRCYWSAGRWRVERAQLLLFPTVARRGG